VDDAKPLIKFGNKGARGAIKDAKDDWFNQDDNDYDDEE